MTRAMPNMALDLAPFGRWTLRDKARSAGQLYVMSLNDDNGEMAQRFKSR